MSKDDDIDEEIKKTRLRLERASSDMTEKLELLERRLRDTVERVKLNLDPRYQVARYPWPMVGASIVLGFFLGSLGRSRAEDSQPPRSVVKERKLRGVEDSLGAELAGLKGIAIGAIIKLLVNMVKQAFTHPGDARHAEHSAHNGGEPHERRLEAGKY
jgi:ElaB/YqjD/DUF883 family membrane-anchored ribosome-binding protein